MIDLVLINNLNRICSLKMIYYTVFFLLLLTSSKAAVTSEKEIEIFLAKQSKMLEAKTISDRELNFIKSISNGKPVSITLLYEALCPFCRTFLTEQLYPAYKRLKSTNVIKTINLVPYGLAYVGKSKNNQYKYFCQHGQVECKINTMENCIIYYANNDYRKYMTPINCMESALNPLSAAKKCVLMSKLDWKKIYSCANGKQGNKLMYKASLFTSNIFKGLKNEFVPYLMINGKFSNEQEDLSQTNFKKLLIEKYLVYKPKNDQEFSIQDDDEIL